MSDVFAETLAALSPEEFRPYVGHIQRIKNFAAGNPYVNPASVVAVVENTGLNALIRKLRKFVREHRDPDKKYIVEFGSHIYTLSNTWLTNIKNAIRADEQDVQTPGSDENFISFFEGGEKDVVIRELTEAGERCQRLGAFFPYLYSGECEETAKELSKYGIYTKVIAQHEPCVLATIRHFSDDAAERAWPYIKHDHISVHNLRAIGSLAEIEFRVYNPEKKELRLVSREYKTKVALCNFKGHFFPYVKMGRSNSYMFVRDLFDKGEFEPIDHWDSDLLSFEYMRKEREESTTMLDSFSQVRYQKEKQYKKKTHKPEFAVFDFETYNNEEGRITPFVCSIKSEHGVRSFSGINCAEKMLRYIKDRDITYLFAHNLGFDIQFINRHTIKKSWIGGCKNIKRATLSYSGHEFTVQCSHAIISAPLANFGKMFGLKIAKTDFPYGACNSETVEEGCSLELALKHCKDPTQFVIDHPDEWYELPDKAAEYCEMDCEVTYNGIKTFNAWLKELDSENIDLTINRPCSAADLAGRFMEFNGVFAGCPKISGVARRFLEKTVVGGRVCTLHNQKQMHVGILQDLDATSLYPAAMARRECVFPTGNCINITDFDYVRKHKFAFFISVRLLSIGRRMDIPIISYVNENSRVWSDGEDAIGRIYNINYIDLEDWIKFHNVTIEFIEGVYFDGKGNPQIQDTIKTLFERRLKLKSEGNPAESIYKLLMNSAYGKTILKEHDTKVSFVTCLEDAEKKMKRCFHQIVRCTKLDGCDQYRIDKKVSVSEHSNRAYCGSIILSISRRIMSEVCDLAPPGSILYTDTDSLHIKDSVIPGIVADFRAKYGRELIGKNLGQFHTDFEKMKGADYAYASKSFLVGKKTYLDVLQNVFPDGTEKESHHIRLKGIPFQSIEYYCEQKGITYEELFKKLMAGETVVFDLACGGSKFTPKWKFDGTITNLPIFERRVSFK